MIVGIGFSPLMIVGKGHSPLMTVGIGHSPLMIVGIGLSPLMIVGIGDSPVMIVGIGLSPHRCHTLEPRTHTHPRASTYAGCGRERGAVVEIGWGVGSREVRPEIEEAYPRLYRMPLFQ